MLTLHELVISGEDAWVTANKNVAKDLSSYGGAYNGALIDSAVQEYNLKTGKLLRNWDALDHIPLEDSYASVPTNGFPWDAYHVNSIALTGRRRLPRLDAQHLGRLSWSTSPRAKSNGRSAARNRASRSAPAPTSSGSTTLPLGWVGIPIPRSRCSTITAAS